MRIHNKQFFIGTHSTVPHPDWIIVDLGRGLHLCHCPAAKVVQASDLDGTVWYLIGTANTYGHDLEEPQALLPRLRTREVEETTMKWAGRWCLISDRLILTDATNLIGLAYDEAGQQVASSVALLNHLLTGQPTLPQQALTQAYYHNWYLLPLTGYEHVRRLLPQQKLVAAQTSSWMPHLRPYAMQSCAALSYEEVYEELKTSFENEVRYLAIRQSLALHIALSGGYDSRLILAVALSTSLPFQCYTQTFESIKISDYTTPPRLCRNHRYLAGQKENPQARRLFDQQNGRHALDMDRTFFARGQWDSFQKGDVCLRGGMLELAGHSQAHLYDRVGQLGFEDIDARLFNFALKDYRPFQINSMTEFFRFQRQHPLPGFDFNKEYYLNQRIAGWLSYIETGLDLLPCTSYNPGNSIYQINLMNALPERVRKSKGFHLDYIYRNQPQLLEQPFNSATLVQKVKAFLNTKSGRFLFK